MKNIVFINYITKINGVYLVSWSESTPYGSIVFSEKGFLGRTKKQVMNRVKYKLEQLHGTNQKYFFTQCD